MKIVGLQLDLARQKETVEYVKWYIDFAKENGYNTVFLYLEGSVRTECAYFFDEKDSYSVEEIKEFVAYSEKVGIELVPIFENLSNLAKFFIYPQLENMSECVDEEKEGRGFTGGRGQCGCVSNPDFCDFVDRYVFEAGSLFTGRYIHVGMDEPFDFAVCPRCQQRIKNGETKADLFYKHVMRTYELVKAMGKRMMMWDDFFEYMDVAERLPRDIIFCNWNYMHIVDEPGGHWVNRKKKDWFAYYDKLGFEYLYCTYANRASSVYNVETFDRYAQKYSPMGALMTTWCRADSFYHGAYPYIAYAGRKWSGRVTREDAVAVYAEFLGSEECAKLVLSLNVPNTFSPFNDVATVCENDSFAKNMYADSLAYAVDRLAELAEKATDEAQKEIILDIRGNVKEASIEFSLQSLGIDIFDNYESKKYPAEYFIEKLDRLEHVYDELEENGAKMWRKYRPNIVSYCDKFAEKYRKRRGRIQKVKADLLQNGDVGVLYADLMLHDGFCTVKIEVNVQYAGEEAPTRVYRGAAKSSLVILEAGGCYTLRFAIKNKPVEWLSFTVFGEGALYPMNFRYTQNGQKFVAERILSANGKVQNAQNVLINDTQFAEMGENDGQKHFDDVTISKAAHEVKIAFRPLV